MVKEPKKKLKFIGDLEFQNSSKLSGIVGKVMSLGSKILISSLAGEHLIFR